MNHYQRTAITHHCRFAFECAEPSFAHLTANGKYSLVLTVNSGYE